MKWRSLQESTHQTELRSLHDVSCRAESAYAARYAWLLANIRSGITELERAELEKRQVVAVAAGFWIRIHSTPRSFARVPHQNGNIHTIHTKMLETG